MLINDVDKMKKYLSRIADAGLFVLLGMIVGSCTILISHNLEINEIIQPELVIIGCVIIFFLYEAFYYKTRIKNEIDQVIAEAYNVGYVNGRNKKEYKIPQYNDKSDK